MPEISEADLAENEQLRARLRKIYANPKSRRLAEQAFKIVEPTAATPTLDEEAEREAPLKAIETKLDTFMKEQSEKREKEESERKLAEFAGQVEQQYEQLRSQGWSQEGIDGVKKIAEQKSLMPLDAAAIFEKEHPPQSVATPGGYGGPWNFMEPVDDSNKSIQSLIASKGDNENVLNKMIQDTFTDVRGPSQARR